MPGPEVGVEWDVRYHHMIHEVGEAVLAAFDDIGIKARRLVDPADERSFERVLLISLSPDRWRDLLARPPAPRTLWYGEPLPSATSALGNVLRSFPSARLLDVTLAVLPRRVRPSSLIRLRERAAAEREPVRNLRMLRRIAPSIDLLAVSAGPSDSLADYPRPVRQALWGYHPHMCGALVDPARDRDVPVLVLASARDQYGRRETALAALRAQLEPEVPVLRISADLRGKERHELLSRTKVIVDLHRVPGNFGALRLVLGSAAGAVVVSEPYASTSIFVRGVHHLEAPIADLGSTVRGLLADEDRRREMARATQELLAGPASLTHNLRLVLAPATT
jgi:hypothetical protein